MARYFVIKARHSQKSLDVRDASMQEGTTIVQFSYHGGRNQQWELRRAGGRYFYIVARHSGMCLDVHNRGTANGQPIIQYRINGGYNQQWEIIDLGDSFYRIVARHSDKVLDVSGASVRDRTQIIQFSWHGQTNQQWEFHEVNEDLTVSDERVTLELGEFEDADTQDIKDDQGKTMQQKAPDQNDKERPQRCDDSEDEEDCQLHTVYGDPQIGYVAGDDFGLARVTYAVVDGLAIFQGDIILGPADVLEGNAREVEANLERADSGDSDLFGPLGSVIIGQKYRWPGARIPYEIASNLPNQTRITRAIAHWESMTPVRFFPRRSTDRNYVRFVPSTVCSSYVGMQGGMQPINLANGCGTAAAIHEIGHAFGLWHEQSRQDRDRHVVIHWQNIIPAAQYNFNIAALGRDVGAYDHGSIMHYGAYDFSSNGRRTITTIPPGIPIGVASGLSRGDVQTINEIVQGSMGTFYFLRARHSEKFLDVPGASTGDGVGIIQHRHNGNMNQQWSIIDAGGGYNYIVARHSGKCLDVPAGNPADGVQIIQYRRNEQDNQQWRLRRLANGAFLIESRRTGKSLDVKGASTQDGAQIIQWQSHGSLNQQWDFIPVSQSFSPDLQPKVLGMNITTNGEQ